MTGRFYHRKRSAKVVQKAEIDYNIYKAENENRKVSF